MNMKTIIKMLGRLFFLEAIFMIPSVGIAIYEQTWPVAQAFLITMLLLLGIAVFTTFFLRNEDSSFYAREGFLLVALSWLLISVFGALPFFLSGEIPNYIDAFFEMVSGFTTTGASILANVETLSRALIYWRSFSHWLGGMGILVFMLAVVPHASGSGETIHVLQAESPGPSVEKLVPKTRQHAALLYRLYLLLSLLCLFFLLIGGMPLFDSLCTMFGTAGTGGFGIKADSMASYSPYLQGVVAVFMALFGINFNLLYLMTIRRFKEAFADEELRTYLGIMITAIILITLNTVQQVGHLTEAFHHAAFTVSSIMTSTGYSTANFDAWPEFSRALLLVLMFFGASAGSTGGGIKMIRLVILIKAGAGELRRLLHPRAVTLVKVNGRIVNDQVLRGVNTFIAAYAALLLVSFLTISLDNFSLESNFSAVVSCLSNIGPGLGAVGPLNSFADYSWLSKLVLSADMLLGRLEIFPILLLFNPRSWNRAS